jgi:hypothetical protein
MSASMLHRSTPRSNSATVTGGRAEHAPMLAGEARSYEHQSVALPAAPSCLRSAQGHVASVLWGLIMPEEKALWDIGIMLLLLWVCFGTTFIICFDIAVCPHHCIVVHCITSYNNCI